jgi:hypothetical protein
MRSKRLGWAIGALVAVTVLVVVARLSIKDWQTAGQVGDYLNLIGSLANAIALLVAFHELGLQREAMAQTVKAQNDQAAAQTALVEAQQASTTALREAAAAQQRANTLAEVTQESTQAALTLQRKTLDVQMTTALASFATTLYEQFGRSHQQANKLMLEVQDRLMNVHDVQRTRVLDEIR